MNVERLWRNGMLRATAAGAIMLGMGLAARVSAGDIVWTGGDETWFDTGNWNLGRLPVGGSVTSDNAIVRNNGTARIEAPGAVSYNVTIAENGSGNLFVGPGGTLSCNLLQTYGIQKVTHRGEIVMAGGTVDCTRIYFSYNGPGLILVTGGVARVAGAASAILGGTGYGNAGPFVLHVGGNGRMEMAAGSEAKLGRVAGTRSYLHLSGNGVMTNLSTLVLGHSSSNCLGMLTISNNAALHMTGNLYIAGDSDDDDFATEFGSTGIVEVAGGSLCTAGDIYPGFFGMGMLNIKGGTVACAGSMIINYRNGYASVRQSGGLVDVKSLYFGYGASRISQVYYHLEGGALRVRLAVTSPMTDKADAVFNLTGGTFSFWRWDRINHPMPDLVNAGATMSPGLENAGYMDIQTNYVETAAACRFQVDLGGTAQATSAQGGVTNALGYYDHVNVAGMATLQGDLDVRFINGFEEAVKATDKFTVMATGGGIAGAFANVASGGRIATADRHSFLVYYGSNAATTGAGLDPKKVTLTGFKRAPMGSILTVR